MYRFDEIFTNNIFVILDKNRKTSSKICNVPQKIHSSCTLLSKFNTFHSLLLEYVVTYNYYICFEKLVHTYILCLLFLFLFLLCDFVSFLAQLSFLILRKSVCFFSDIFALFCSLSYLHFWFLI